MAKNEVKWGALLSYILIFVNSVYGLIISPFMLGAIGESEYGVYKTIGALAATVSVMELGLGGTVQRFLAQYRAQKEEKKSFNFSAMSMIQAGFLCFLMLVVGVVLYTTIDPVYGKSFTHGELIRAKQIFCILIIYVALHIFENVFFGIIAGYNNFVFSNSLKITSLVMKIVLYLILLPIFKNALVIVIVSLCLELVTIIIEFLYIAVKLKHKIKLYYWDQVAFKDSFKYTVLLFIQSLIIQFNGNIDNMVIGAVIGTTAVTVYSFAIQIFNMYEQCATSVSGVVLPSVTNMIYNGATSKDLENVVVKFGRVQWAILGAALGGFVSLGKEFFALWLGEGFSDCYYLALILMVPVTLPLIINVCLSILKAKNLLAFRTIALAYSAVINGILTVIGTKIWGYWAAAVGTAISTIVGSIISLNIYYKVKLNMNILCIYGRILHRITPCIIIASVVCWLLNDFWSGSWLHLGCKAAIFIVIYGVTMLLFGLKKEEKRQIPVLNIIFRRSTK